MSSTWLCRTNAERPTQLYQIYFLPSVVRYARAVHICTAGRTRAECFPSPCFVTCILSVIATMVWRTVCRRCEIKKIVYHTHTHTHTHIYIYIYIYIYTHTHTQAITHTITHTYTHARTHAERQREGGGVHDECVCMCVRVCVRAHARAFVCVCMCARAH